VRNSKVLAPREPGASAAAVEASGAGRGSGVSSSRAAGSLASGLGDAPGFARTGCVASLICLRSLRPIIITTNFGFWAAIISLAARGQSGYSPRGSFRPSVRISPDEVRCRRRMPISGVSA